MITIFKIFERKIYDINEELFDAVVCGNLTKLKKLLKLKPNINYVMDDDGGNTLLIMAAGINFTMGVIELTNSGADWTIINDDNCCFYEYLNDEEKELIKQMYPEKFKKIELFLVSKKYNI